jgi:hypothetical protein
LTEEQLLRVVTSLYGPYVAYAVVMGEEELERAERFQNWVLENSGLVDRFDVPDLYDLWLGVPERSL